LLLTAPLAPYSSTLSLHDALPIFVPAGQHPHSCAFGADKRFLYVSNWGSRSVSVIDVEKNRRVADIPVGLRPNDMALARDGRLRSEEHTSELQSRENLVCRLLLEK